MNYQQHITLALSAIDDEIDDLRAQRRRLIDAMGWEAAPVEAEPTAARIDDAVIVKYPTVPVASSKSATARLAAAERATCPECGKEMSRMGIGSHRAKSHGYRAGVAAPAPQTPAAAPVAATKPVSGPKVLACSECDFTAATDDVKALSTHAITTHKRPPLPVERTPVVAA